MEAKLTESGKHSNANSKKERVIVFADILNIRSRYPGRALKREMYQLNTITSLIEYVETTKDSKTTWWMWHGKPKTEKRTRYFKYRGGGLFCSPAHERQLSFPAATQKLRELTKAGAYGAKGKHDRRLIVAGGIGGKIQ